MNIFSPQKKVLCNIDTVYRFLLGDNPPPVLVEIDPSNSCNHQCTFCLSKHINRQKDTFILSRDILLSVCNDLNDLGVKAINFTGGGEPTINPYLPGVIASLRNVEIGLFTNGSLLHKNNLINTIINNVTWIRIGIDAANGSTYEKIHKGSWRNLWDNIRLLGSDKHTGITIGVGFIITQDNCDEIIDFAELISSYPFIDYCQYKPEIKTIEDTNGIQNTNEFWNNEAVPRLVCAKEILGEKFQINLYKLNDLLYGDGREYGQCLGSQLQPCIGADGLVYICPNFRGYPEYSYGSLYEKSFREIWNDIYTRKKLIKKITDENFCNCTPLCKPHESNKMMWKLHCEYQEGLKLRSEIDHWKFI